MSFSTTSKLGDEFLCVLRLDVAGINWVVYKDRFLWSIDARGLLDHLKGTEVEPTDLIDAKIRADTKPLNEEKKLVDMEWKKAMKEWRQGDVRGCSIASESMELSESLAILSFYLAIILPFPFPSPLSPFHCNCSSSSSSPGRI